MRIGHTAAVVLLLAAPLLTSCGGDDASGETEVGPGSGSTSDGDGDGDSASESPGTDATEKPAKVGTVKACDVITKAEAAAFLGTPVDHPGDTPAEKKASGSATYCAWARPGTPFVFDDAPATAVTVSRNPKLIKKLAGAGIPEVDVAGHVAYKDPDDDDNTGYAYVVLDKETLVLVGSVRKAGTPEANADLAVELARTGFTRLAG